MDNFADAVKGFWEFGGFDEGFDLWAGEFVNGDFDIWKLTFALKLHEGEDFSGFDFRVVVVDHGGVTKGGAVGSYRPAVSTFKVTLEEDLSWVGDIELAVLFGDGLKVGPGTCRGLCARKTACVRSNWVVRTPNASVWITVDFELFGLAFDFFPG